MTSPKSPPPAGAGAIIAGLIIIGTIGGGMMGQPSIGFLSGLGLGCAIAAVMWLRTRGR